ncbi:MAG: heme exporter protein CcmB [Candidatus Geothermarchaeales archaeon]
MRLLTPVLEIARKDIQVEFRRPYEVVSILAFSVGSTLICSFAWRGGIALSPVVTSAALWVILFFTGVLTFTTSFIREMDRGTIGGLRSLPCPPIAILLGKTLYSLVLLLMVEAVLLPSALIFLNLKIPPEGALWLLVVFALGVINLSVAGSFISALVMFSEGKNLLLSFLLFPVTMPVLIPSVMATEKLVGPTAASIDPELRLLVAFLLFILFLALLTFEYVLED